MRKCQRRNIVDTCPNWADFRRKRACSRSWARVVVVGPRPVCRPPRVAQQASAALPPGRPCRRRAVDSAVSGRGVYRSTHEPVDGGAEPRPRSLSHHRSGSPPRKQPPPPLTTQLRAHGRSGR